MKSYIQFSIIADSGKTTTTQVQNSQYGDPLGLIKWHSAWRRYVFFPATDCLFDVSCLTDITEHITKLMEARK